jgi:hypothetical protein
VLKGHGKSCFDSIAFSATVTDSNKQGGGCDKIIGPGKVIDREVKPETWGNRNPASVTVSKAGWVETPIDVLSFISPLQK